MPLQAAPLRRVRRSPRPARSESVDLLSARGVQLPGRASLVSVLLRCEGKQPEDLGLVSLEDGAPPVTGQLPNATHLSGKSVWCLRPRQETRECRLRHGNAALDQASLSNGWPFQERYFHGSTSSKVVTIGVGIRLSHSSGHFRAETRSISCFFSVEGTNTLGETSHSPLSELSR